jgi:hypothetical protein
VALPMDEQRILEQMERMLAADDPRLAARLAAFGQPGVGQVLRTRRARAVLSLLTLTIIACVAAVFYMVSAFRLAGHAPAAPARQHSSQSAPSRLSMIEQPTAVPGSYCILLVNPKPCTQSLSRGPVVQRSQPPNQAANP